jgi:hypothetical protein
MNTVEVYIDGVFLCTMPVKRVRGMLEYLRSKGINNVRIKEDA